MINEDYRRIKQCIIINIYNIDIRNSAKNETINYQKHLLTYVFKAKPQKEILSYERIS